MNTKLNMERMKKNLNRKNTLKIGLWGVLSLLPPIVCFYLVECYTHNPFEDVRPWAQFFNILLFELAAVFFFFLTGRLKIAYRIIYTVAMIYGIVNAYVVRFRTNPIVPWDIFSIKTAINVAGNYDFKPDARMVIVTVIFFILIAAMKPVNIRLQGMSFWKRLIPSAASILVIIIFSATLQRENFQNRYRIYNKLFTPVFMTDAGGLAVTFVMNMAYMSIDKPAGYDTGEAEAVLASYTEEISQAEELPNIIVMMNESFSDLAVLGEFETNMDYMPYLRSLQEGAENTVTGMLNVSVCGGNTANTEFEFLTGNTMAFLPQGSIPYQQYITDEIPSLGGHLKDLGYETLATHPYYSTGWDRDTIYPILGFDESIFLNGYHQAEYLRDYVSDQSCVDKITEAYEGKTEGKPLFVFNITMQNHGAYDEIYGNFTPEIAVSGVDNTSVTQFISLIKRSDEALEQMIRYFSGVDEKTMIVFFGDHQPSDTIAAPILAMNGMAWNDLDEEEQKLRYQVPYVIWANYGIESASEADTSTNYLAAEALRLAGVPLSPYQSFLLDVKEKYPIISTIRTVDDKGRELSAADESKEMDDYRKLQYYQLFD